MKSEETWRTVTGALLVYEVKIQDDGGEEVGRDGGKDSWSMPCLPGTPAFCGERHHA
jgi:hypothetical protein